MLSDPVIKEHGRLAVRSAHSSPTKLASSQTSGVVTAGGPAAVVVAASAQQQQQQHLGM